MKNKLNILVVEDNDQDRLLIVNSIRQSGFEHEVKVAESIDDAIVLTSKHNFDVIFLDYYFPVKNGSDFIRHYTSKNGTGNIVVVTSQEDVKMAVDCMKMGAIDYVTKNQLTPTAIAKSIQYALQAKDSRDHVYRAEQALLESELKLKSIIAKSPIIIFNIDQTGKFTLYKGKAASYLHIRPEEVVGNNVSEIEGHTPIRLADYRLACKEMQTQFTSQVNNHFFDVNYIPIKNEVKEITGMMGVAIDITSFKREEGELRNSLEETEAAARIKEQFLANMSHEIRTPIHGIISLTQFVLKTNLDDEQRRYLELIRKSADNLSVIINDILDLSKMDADKMTFEEINFNLPDTIQTAVAAFIPKTIDKNIQIRTEISDSLPTQLSGDPVRLTQVLNNLLGNAVKFTEKGSVTIAASVKEKNTESAVIEFRVRDTGIGIPPQKLGTIFESFSQAGADITRKYGGTGLGLSISKKLVELQHGTIRVESLVDAGTTFIFEIPFKLGTQEKEITTTAKLDIAFDRNLHLLVAEDNDINRFIIEKMLKDWNIQVTFAKTGTEAVEQASKMDFDLILMDVEMPDMNGYRATEIIRNDFEAPKNQLPIIALTGNAMQGEREKCIQAGMNDYISKPFKAEELKEKIFLMTAQSKSSSANSTTVERDSHVSGPVSESIPQEESIKKLTDLQFLRDISENNEQFFREFIQMFLTNTPKAISDMENALETQNWEQLRQSSHKVKPSFNYVGLKELSQITARIEECAKTQNNLDQVAGMIATVKKTSQQAFIELEKELNLLSTH